jgi:hypothetical protein
MRGACYNKAPRDVIEALVQDSPKEASVPGDGFYDHTPLQIVIDGTENTTEETVQIVKMLVDADIDGLDATNEWGHNAFETTCRRCGGAIKFSVK